MFIVKDKPHPRFRRDGVNLIHTAKVPLGRALTGCTVEIHTLDERILHIPINDIVKYVGLPQFIDLSMTFWQEIICSCCS